MSKRPEYQTIDEYMEVVDGMFIFVRDETAEEYKYEIETHLRQLAQQATFEGLSAQEAEREAIRQFGSPSKTVAPLMCGCYESNDDAPNHAFKLTWLNYITPFTIPIVSFAGMYISSRPLLLFISLALGTVVGVAESFAKPIQAKCDTEESKQAWIREKLKMATESISIRNAKLTDHIPQICYAWLIRRTIEDYFSPDRSPLTAINFRFFAIYATALLVTSFLPQLPARMALYLITQFMWQVITTTLRRYFIWRRLSRS